MSAPDRVPAVGRSESPPWWPVLVVLGALWLLAVRQLRFEWTINPQYTYGWTVPFLAAYLFLERWKCRPPAQIAHSRVGVALLVLVLALMLFPIRLVEESGPDWRLLGWALGGVCVAISLCAVYFAGGAAWLRHFFFPVAFFLVAVPWPVPIEQSLIQWLMRSVSGICVEALSWAGIPAIQKGNVIEIATGRVGVEEACSGVRSLQTTLMIALFMGELLRFGIIRRLVLLGGALGVAFVCNAGRAFFLVWVSAKSSTDAVAKWHDNVGFAVLFGSLVGVGILCAILNPKRRETPDVLTDPGLLRPTAPPRKGILIAFVAWLVIVEAGTETWYRMAEARAPKEKPWTVRWPTAAQGFRDVEFSDVTRNILKYTDARSAVWSDADGLRWAMVMLHWAPGRTSVQLARAHGPEVCLPAGGAVMTADLGPRPMRINGVDLPARAYTFRTRDQTLYVFYCLWEQRPDAGAAQSTASDLTIARRLDAVRMGMRNEGQQAIEVAVSDVAGPEQAQAAVKRFLEKTIQP
ncbi:MAG: exosortase/archaeosortase family protein [Chthoniobacteraceae bacterium]